MFFRLCFVNQGSESMSLCQNFGISNNSAHVQHRSTPLISFTNSIWKLLMCASRSILGRLLSSLSKPLWKNTLLWCSAAKFSDILVFENSLKIHKIRKVTKPFHCPHWVSIQMLSKPQFILSYHEVWGK